MVPEFIRKMFPLVDFDYEDDPELEDDEDDQEYWPPEGAGGIAQLDVV